jgi:pyruvate kinase
MVQLPNHKTKIVCTIGPASRTDSGIKNLIKSGMNVARLNFSHGHPDDHMQDIRRIRSIASHLNREVAILIDLPGIKIRIGTLQSEPLVLKKDDSVTLTTEHIIGTVSRIPVNYAQLSQSVSKGSLIYLNDGFLQLKVWEVSDNEVKCKVVIGGPLLSQKGVNLPQAKLSMDPITEKDLDFVELGLKEGVDTFGTSFIEKADDILKVKEFARRRGKSIYVVAKIERAEAARNIDELLGVADAIMIARGDLGVQIPIEDVPAVQKSLIRRANLRGRPVITATQMLQSMTENIRPTRAEVTDVANAILDGTDAVMLSEETAIGKYPVETVNMMARIAVSTERERRAVKRPSDLEDYFKTGIGGKKVNAEDVVSLSVIQAVRALNARFIVTPTYTGSTPRRISRFKPDCWILSFSNYVPTYRFLALSYGVYPFLIKESADDWHDATMQLIKEFNLAKKGDRVVLTEGKSLEQISDADSLRIVTVS